MEDSVGVLASQGERVAWACRDAASSHGADESSHANATSLMADLTPEVAICRARVAHSISKIASLSASLGVKLASSP